MKMPGVIDYKMFAPCGVNCLVCYKHAGTKKNTQPCMGCRKGDLGKTGHCRKCKIKDCVQSKNLTYCFECEIFPCQLIKRLEQSYNKRYGVSPVNNSLSVQAEGLAKFMKTERKRWLCPDCGGIISQHNKICGECLKILR